MAVAAFPAAAQDAISATPVSLADLKAMSRDSARPGMPVTVEGVVVWAQEGAVRFYDLQDKQVGIRVVLAEGAPLPVRGDQVRVSGMVEGSGREARLRETQAEVTGHPGLPKARRMSAASMASGMADGTRVNIRGSVRQAQMEGTGLHLVLDSDGSRISVQVVEADGVDPPDLIGQYLSASGVVDPGADPGSFRILISSYEGLDLRRRSPAEPKGVQAIGDLFRFRKGHSWGDRVRIRGQVIGVLGDGIHLHDGSGGIIVRADSVPADTAGIWVEAVGFPEYDDGRQIFADAELRSTAPQPPVKPEEVDAAALALPAADHRYVRVEGKLVDFMRQPVPAAEGGTAAAPLMLVVNSGGTVFDVAVPRPEKAFAPEAGSWLSVEGVVDFHPGREGAAGGLRIIAFPPHGVSVIRGPGFFTERRLLILLCGTLLVLAATGFRALVVTKRNAGLLAEARERQAITSERARLSADMHDTLEQMLTAMHLQIHALGPKEGLPETVRSGVTSIHDLIRQCHVEIRNLLWDLRPAALEKYDLCRALERMAASLVLGTSTRVTVIRSGDLPPLPALVEDNLLRIGQEALTNAVKHGKPAEITIHLRAEDGVLELGIADDGCGMPEGAEEGFGLRGMRERAERIGGSLKLTAGDERGTVVRVAVVHR